MGKRHCLIFMLCIMNAVFSQETEEENRREGLTNNGETRPEIKRRSDAHWAGVDFGCTMLMNVNFENKFESAPYWETDPIKSQVWNVNLLEQKFAFGTPYVGVTTGLGCSFSSLAFKNDYVLQSSTDSLYAVVDTINRYSKNKLKASYLTVPILLEFNTNYKSERSFYILLGVIGGVRMTSKMKKKGSFEGGCFQQKEKGTFALSPFKIDAAFRFGYGALGVFANYSLLPLFETEKTESIYPFTFGISLNF